MTYGIITTQLIVAICSAVSILHLGIPTGYVDNENQCWASYFLKVTSYILHITCN